MAKITTAHINFCRHVALTDNATEAYLRYFQIRNRKTAAVAACNIMKRPEIKSLIAEERIKLEEERQAMIREDIEKTKKGILSVLELDFYNSEIIRGNIEVNDIVSVRDYVVDYDNEGKIIGGRWVTNLRKIKRTPSLKEIQRSIYMLYQRAGALKTGTKSPEDDSAPIIGEPTEMETYILLSNGEKLQIPS